MTPKETPEKIVRKCYPYSYSEGEVKAMKGKEVYSYQLDLYGNNVYLEKVTGGGFLLKQTYTHFPSTRIENIIPIPQEDMEGIIKELGYVKLPKDKPPLIHADGCTTNLGIIGATCNCGAETQWDVWNKAIYEETHFNVVGYVE